MKKLITIAISVLFILALAGISIAAEQKAAPAAAPAATPAATPDREAKPLVKTKYTTGNVVSVDKAANTITIKDKAGEIVFTITKKTHVIIDAKRRSIDLLVPGEKVSVRYVTKGDKNIAKRINLMPVMGQ